MVGRRREGRGGGGDHVSIPNVGAVSNLKLTMVPHDQHRTFKFNIFQTSPPYSKCLLHYIVFYTQLLTLLDARVH